MESRHQYFQSSFQLERHTYLHFSRGHKEVLNSSYPEIGAAYMLAYYSGFCLKTS